MLILGLVGGIASGKSLVANILRDMGALVLDADQAGQGQGRKSEREHPALERVRADRILNFYSGDIDCRP